MTLLTLARDLQRRKGRERRGAFVAEGVRAAEELLRSPLGIRGALVAPALAAAPRGRELRATLAERGVPVLELSPPEFQSAASTESPQGVLLIGEIPARPVAALALPPRARVLVLDAIQDPGNAGALLRTAAALGAAAVLAMPGTVDLWNGKVVRSAMGALFHRPALACTWEELDGLLAEHGIPLWAADAGGEPLPLVTSTPPGVALVVGNEGAGLSPDAASRAVRRIAIPIAPDIESLNVVVAAGLLLYAFRT